MAFGAAAYAVGTPVRIQATGVVGGGTAMARTYAGGGASQAEQTALPSCILGFFINASSSGVISLASNNAGAAGTVFGGNITLPSAGQFVTYPALTPNGVFCTIVSGTCDLTFFVIE